jgi:hypothetical protein
MDLDKKKEKTKQAPEMRFKNYSPQTLLCKVEPAKLKSSSAA